jgi:hypothetical protein
MRRTRGIVPDVPNHDLLSLVMHIPRTTTTLFKKRRAGDLVKRVVNRTEISTDMDVDGA